MKSGPFTLLCALALRLDPQSVLVASRHLKKAGLMSTGAHGINAPEMTPRDLAVLVLFFLASGKPAWAVDVVTRHAGFQLSAPSMEDAVASLLPDPDHTVLDLLTVLCSHHVNASYESEIIIRAVAESSIEIEGNGWHIVYVPRGEMEQDVKLFAQLDYDNLTPEILDAIANSKLNQHGVITIREVKLSCLELIKRFAFPEVAE